jgi:hypothetical protein
MTLEMTRMLEQCIWLPVSYKALCRCKYNTERNAALSCYPTVLLLVHMTDSLTTQATL